MTFREQCAEIKANLKIEHVAKVFLKLTPENGTYRAPCPACNAGGERAIVITPKQGVFYCFHAKTGGSVIDLVAHVKDMSTQEAVEYLQEEKPPNGFDYVKYRESLAPAPGVPEDVSKALGIGVAQKGVHRGRIAFPLFDENGKFLVYASASDIRLPKQWRP